MKAGYGALVLGREQRGQESAKTSHYTSSLASREVVSKEPESEQHQPEGAGESEGAFELDRVEHKTGGVLRSRRIMPVSRLPLPLSRRVTGNCLSGVGCGVPYNSLTHDDLAGGEVADEEGSSRVVNVGAENDALGPAWRQLVLGF